MIENYNTSSPDELMILAKHGDSEAYGAVYNDFFTPVFRYIYRRTGEQELAEDLTQTVFLKAFKSIEKFSNKGVSPLAYFFTVARNTVIDFLKKKNDVLIPHEEFSGLQVAAPERDCPSRKMQQNETKKDIETALESLNIEQREVLTLRFINGFKNSEIATIVQKSEDTVRQLQCRGLKKLRTMVHLKIHL